MALALKRPARFAPRDYRQGVTFAAALILADDRIVDIEVRNLSARGFMGRCDTALIPGGWVGVDLPGYGIVRALVRWYDDGEFGCQFRNSIDVDRLADIRAHQPEGCSLFRATRSSACGSDRVTA